MKEALEQITPAEYIPNVIRSDELSNLPVNFQLRKEVNKLMTPEKILQEKEFERPEVIDPIKYPDFDSLVHDREKVRLLHLLPIKSEEEYVRYHLQSKESLISRVLDSLGNGPMALVCNAFPYLLPDDLAQYIVWVKQRESDRSGVVDFITQCMQYLSLSQEEVILFERPEQTMSRLVKGSFKELRHIHFWFKLKTN